MLVLLGSGRLAMREVAATYNMYVCTCFTVLNITN